MENLEELKVIIEAEIAQYRKDIEEVKRVTKSATNQVDREVGKMKKSFSSIGGFIKKAVIGAGIGLIGRQALNLASDVRETESVIDLAFGNMRKSVDDYAKTSLQTHGISSLTAKQTAGDYMLMSRGMDIAMDKASMMSIEVTKLSADMASMKNTTQEMAKTALSGIWTGETEALNFSAVA